MKEASVIKYNWHSVILFYKYCYPDSRWAAQRRPTSREGAYEINYAYANATKGETITT